MFYVSFRANICTSLFLGGKFKKWEHFGSSGNLISFPGRQLLHKPC